jgi:hypothetical protein
MRKKEKHIAHTSKLDRFRTFQDMKSSPILFPSTKPIAQRQAELNEAFTQLRASYTEISPRRSMKSNKKTKK